MSTRRTKRDRLDKLHVAFVPLLLGDTLCETILKNNVDINTRAVPLYLSHLLCLQGGASTALMIAAEQGSYEIIKILLEHGADINAVNKVVIGWDGVTV